MSKSFAILNQFERKGWQITPVEDGWKLSHSSAEREVYLHVTSQWYCLACPLNMEETRGTAHDGPAYHLYRHLLEQNERMYMAKTSLDEHSCLLLMVEVPAKRASQLLLNWALDSLTRFSLSGPGGSGGQSNSIFRDTQTTLYPPDMTPGISKETMSRYIKGIEVSRWGIFDEPDGSIWHLGYKGRLRVFDVYLNCTKTWTYFQVPVLVDRIAPVLLSPETQDQLVFLKYLLRLNYVWFMAKMGISTEGQVLLLLEIPTETLDFALFQYATHTLATYLDRYEQEIQIMASLQHDRQLTELLTTHPVR